jgi:hypothetical protein
MPGTSLGGGLEIMTEKNATDQSLFSFRVLLRFDAKYRVHVAQCIETGSIVTADRQEDLKEMIVELLEDEVSFALKNKNLSNLFSSPAPVEVWTQWVNAAMSQGIHTEWLDLNPNQRELDDIEPKGANYKTGRIQLAEAA